MWPTVKLTDPRSCCEASYTTVLNFFSSLLEAVTGMIFLVLNDTGENRLGICGSKRLFVHYYISTAAY